MSTYAFILAGSQNIELLKMKYVTQKNAQSCAATVESSMELPRKTKNGSAF